MAGEPKQPVALASFVDASDLATALQRYSQGAYDEAAELFAAALIVAPDNPTALRLRGLALTRAGKAMEGVPLLARAVALAPTDPLAHLHYGVGLQIAGRFAEAAELFRASLPLLPANPAPALNLRFGAP